LADLVGEAEGAGAAVGAEDDGEETAGEDDGPRYRRVLCNQPENGTGAVPIRRSEPNNPSKKGRGVNPWGELTESGDASALHRSDDREPAAGLGQMRVRPARRGDLRRPAAQYAPAPPRLPFTGSGGSRKGAEEA
jgi:hypothetical protein